MFRRDTGEAASAREITATRLVLATERAKADAFATRLVGGDTSVEALIGFKRQLSLMAAVQFQLHGMAAEAGRALNAMKIQAHPGLLEFMGGIGRITALFWPNRGSSEGTVEVSRRERRPAAVHHISPGRHRRCATDAARVGTRYRFAVRDARDVPDFVEVTAPEQGRIETQRIGGSTVLNPYLDFPHGGQAFLTERADRSTKKPANTRARTRWGSRVARHHQPHRNAYRPSTARIGASEASITSSTEATMKIAAAAVSAPTTAQRTSPGCVASR